MALRKASAYSKSKTLHSKLQKTSKVLHQNRSKFQNRQIQNGRHQRLRQRRIPNPNPNSLKRKHPNPRQRNRSRPTVLQPFPPSQTRQRILPRSQNLPTPHLTRKQNAYRRRSRPYANRNVPFLRKNNRPSRTSKTKPNNLHNRRQNPKSRNRSPKTNQIRKIKNHLQNLN